MLPKYALYALKSPLFRAFVDDGLNSGSLIQHIHTKQLEHFLFSVAPEKEQYEIVRRLDRAFAWIDHLASEATSARKLADHLDQAVLTKAFQGAHSCRTLDPSDEPASLLLGRIRAGRGMSQRNTNVREKARKEPHDATSTSSHEAQK